MEAYQHRVIAERDELQSKLNSLTHFFGSITYGRLSEAEKSRLLNQSRFMAGYVGVLNERIAAFAPAQG